MDVAVVVLGVVAVFAIGACCAGFAVLHEIVKRHAEHEQWLVEHFSAEREQLLSRIQKPEHSPLPVGARKTPTVPKDPETTAALRSIGTVAPPQAPSPVPS